MNWPAVFLACFVVGFALSVLSFALSALHFPAHVRLPFVHHVPVAPHAHASYSGVAPVNPSTTMAFLAWFGGTGYLLTSQFGWLALPALAVAVSLGVCGAAIVFLLMTRLLWSPRENMRLADSHMIGVLGRLSQPVRQGVTGELIYSQNGTRHSCGARSADGVPIERGTEVVVTAYERGIAYVRRWDDMAADDPS